MTSLTKIQSKIFLSLQTQRLAESFEGFNSSLAQLPGEICSCYDTLENRFSPKNRLAAKVLG